LISLALGANAPAALSPTQETMALKKMKN